MGLVLQKDMVPSIGACSASKREGVGPIDRLPLFLYIEANTICDIKSLWVLSMEPEVAPYIGDTQQFDSSRRETTTHIKLVILLD